MMNRYLQQIILPEIGASGQTLLTDASVLVIGAGGLGIVVAGYLVAMGVGKIGICDFDTIEETNLHRQFCYLPEDVGQHKARVLARQLRKQNPNVNVTEYFEEIAESNIEKIGLYYKLICDCTDRASGRLAINDFCAKYTIPLVHGAVTGWQGYLTVLHYKKAFSLNHIFNADEYTNAQNCSVIGINSAVCGIIGSYMVNESIKIILQLDNVLEGKLFYVNILNNVTRLIQLKH